MWQLPVVLGAAILLSAHIQVLFAQEIKDTPLLPAGADYQKLAENTKWRWSGEKANLLHSVTHRLSEYRTEIICPKRTDETPWPKLTARILDGDKEIASLQAYPETVFTRFGDTLFIAEPRRSGTGCSVTAYDFILKKQLWKSRLASFSPRPHSRYSNRVTIESNSQALMITGNEELLHYVEFLDIRTGKTLAKREYPIQVPVDKGVMSVGCDQTHQDQ